MLDPGLRDLSTSIEIDPGFEGTLTIPERPFVVSSVIAFLPWLNLLAYPSCYQASRRSGTRCFALIVYIAPQTPHSLPPRRLP